MTPKKIDFKGIWHQRKLTPKILTPKTRSELIFGVRKKNNRVKGRSQKGYELEVATPQNVMTFQFEIMSEFRSPENSCGLRIEDWESTCRFDRLRKYLGHKKIFFSSFFVFFFCHKIDFFFSRSKTPQIYAPKKGRFGCVFFWNFFFSN